MRFFRWRRAFLKPCATCRSAVALLALAVVFIVNGAPVLAESHEATAVEATFGLEYSVPTGPRNLAEEAPRRIWYTATDGIGFLEVLSDPDQPAVLYHTDFYGTGEDSQPYDLVFSKGIVWFTLHGLRGLGRIDVVTRQMKVYTLLSAGAAPTGIAVDPTGKLWIAQSNGRISRFDPATETFTEFIMPENLVGAPRMEDVAVEDARDIWFTMPDANRVVIFDPIRNRFFGIPTEKTNPTDITIDSGGGIWVTANGSNSVGRFTPTTVSVWIWFATPTEGGGPAGLLVFDDDFGVHQVWVTENNSGTMGRLQINGFALTNRERIGPTEPPGNTWGIIRTSDEHIWVADTGRDLIYELSEPYIHRGYLATVRNELTTQNNHLSP